MTATDAFAQGQNSTVGRPPSLQPTVSPYINLGRGGNAAINYFGIVRPQQQFQQSLGQLENRVLQDETTPAEQGTAAQLTTGHVSTFFNYSHYYPSLTTTTT